MSRNDLHEREFVDRLNELEQKLNPQGFAAYSAGMRGYLASAEGLVRGAAVKKEVRRRILERIFRYACVSKGSGREVVALLGELESVGFARISRRIEAAGLLALWLSSAEGAQRAALGPIERFVTETEMAVERLRSSRSRIEFEAAVSGARAALQLFRSR